MEDLKQTNLPVRLLFAIAMAVVTVWSYLVPDAIGFARPELARIFFWHFPCPMMLTGFMIVGMAFSFRHFLRWEGGKFVAESDPDARRQWDMRATAALELGFIFALLTMATGVLFSLVQWGAAWQWDPRQTSFLLALLIYGAYFALRSATADPEKRASSAAAYMLAATLPLLFLIFVFPRLPQVQEASFHPTDSIMKGQIKGSYGQVITAMLILLTVLSVWLYRLRVRAEILVFENGKLETHRVHPTTTGVVRPVRLPDQS